MGPSCLVLFCPSRGYISGISYHKLGKKRYLSWLNSIGRSGEENLSLDNVICSRHFDKSCFFSLNGKTMLKNNVVPTLFLRRNQQSQHVTVDHVAESSQKRLSSSPDNERGSDNEKGSDIEKNRKLIESFHNYAATIEKTEKQVQPKKIIGIRYKYYKYKVSHLQQVVTILKKKNMITTDTELVLQQTFACVRQIDMKRMLQNAKRGKVSSQKCHPVLRSFAMTLHLYSNRAYEYVRHTFIIPLPSRRIIRKWFSNIHCEPGFSQPAFKSLKAKVDENRSKGYSTFCSLMLDEMSIKKDIVCENGKIWGHVDLGTGIESDGMDYATQALVLMVVAVNGSWKLPIGYFLIRSLKADEKANIVREALIKLNNTGVTITSLTFDGPSINFSMMNALGADPNLIHLQPYFFNPSNHGSKIYCVFDACHLRKMMQINWAMLDKFFDDEGGVVDFAYIKLLNSIQEDNGLQLRNKLKSVHLDWTKKNMKFDSRVQPLNENVAGALEYLMVDLKDPRFKAAGPTIRFIKLMNKVFDLLNSKNPLTIQTKMPLRENNEELWSPVFEEALRFCKRAKTLDNKKLIGASNTSSFKGLIVTIKSVIGMYNDYITTNRMHYLPTYKFSLDHLELFFYSVRSIRGSIYNPTAVQFFHSYKKNLLNYEIKNMTINYKARDNRSTPNLSLNDIHIIRKYDIETVKDAIYDYDYIMPINISPTDLIENVVAYIASFAVKMTERIVTCPVCKESLNKNENFSKNNLLCRKKWRNLIVPSRDVIEVCREVEIHLRRTLYIINNKSPMETTFFNSFITHIYSKLLLLKTNLFQNLRNHNLQNLTLDENHIETLIKTLASSYYKFRVYNLAKNQNCQDRWPLVQSKLNKLILFNHRF